MEDLTISTQLPSTHAPHVNKVWHTLQAAGADTSLMADAAATQGGKGPKGNKVNYFLEAS